MNCWFNNGGKEFQQYIPEFDFIGKPLERATNKRVYVIIYGSQILYKQILFGIGVYEMNYKL